jgi:hypothetical protein
MTLRGRDPMSQQRRWEMVRTLVVALVVVASLALVYRALTMA